MMTTPKRPRPAPTTLAGWLDRHRTGYLVVRQHGADAWTYRWFRLRRTALAWVDAYADCWGTATAVVDCRARAVIHRVRYLGSPEP
jgi:hypothetical protein